MLLLTLRHRTHRHSLALKRLRMYTHMYARTHQQQEDERDADVVGAERPAARASQTRRAASLVTIQLLLPLSVHAQSTTNQRT